jgi:protein-tyrosine phosphatase
VIDLHAHVLPGLDDGARTLDEALAMLRAAAADGTRVVCATPHAFHPDHDVDATSAVAALEALRLAVAAAGIAVELRVASEVRFRPDLDALARAGRLASLGAGRRRYVLVEFPPTHVPAEAEEALFRLRLEGVTPVVAHPERNPSFWADPDAAIRLREQGALLQVTAGSLTGVFRKESRTCALALLDAGGIDLLASDCHRADRRPPGLSEAARVVRRRAGAATAERLVEGTPCAILAGEPVPGAGA